MQKKETPESISIEEGVDLNPNNIEAGGEIIPETEEELIKPDLIQVEGNVNLLVYSKSEDLTLNRKEVVAGILKELSLDRRAYFKHKWNDFKESLPELSFFVQQMSCNRPDAGAYNLGALLAYRYTKEIKHDEETENFSSGALKQLEALLPKSIKLMVEDEISAKNYLDHIGLKREIVGSLSKYNELFDLLEIVGRFNFEFDILWDGALDVCLATDRELLGEAQKLATEGNWIK